MSKADIGIVTMKEEEYEAILDKFEPNGQASGAKRDYDIAVVSTPRGTCRVAITRCAQQGNPFAQTAATEMLADVQPCFLLVVGIAGGVPTVDFCLGDVVVSDYIQDLTIEDTGISSGSERYNALGGPLHPSASRIVERLHTVERAAPSWNLNESIACDRPILEGTHTTEDQDWNRSIDEAIARHAQRDIPIGTARKIASSDRLIKAPQLLRKWRQVLKAVAAVEMESAGVYLTCQRNEVPFLAIRGISDIVGWKRDEAWTRYACHTAAAYARMLIQAGVFVAAGASAPKAGTHSRPSSTGRTGAGDVIINVEGKVQGDVTGRDKTIGAGSSADEGKTTSVHIAVKGDVGGDITGRDIVVSRVG
jgi:nucleoside phosphorylase